DLRRRGHRAFRLPANVPERGIWQRVRIGPFKTKFEATKYKAEFERTERMTPFVVDPDKVKQAAEVRAARLAAREKKDHARIVVHDERRRPPREAPRGARTSAGLLFARDLLLHDLRDRGAHVLAARERAQIRVAQVRHEPARAWEGGC